MGSRPGATQDTSNLLVVPFDSAAGENRGKVYSETLTVSFATVASIYLQN